MGEADAVAACRCRHEMRRLRPLGRGQERLLVRPRDGPPDRERHLLPHHGGDCEQRGGLVAQAAEPVVDDLSQQRWHRRLRDRLSGRPPSEALEQPLLLQAAQQLGQEQRVALGALDQVRGEAMDRLLPRGRGAPAPAPGRPRYRAGAGRAAPSAPRARGAGRARRADAAGRPPRRDRWRRGGAAARRSRARRSAAGRGWRCPPSGGLRARARAVAAAVRATRKSRACAKRSAWLVAPSRRGTGGALAASGRAWTRRAISIQGP